MTTALLIISPLVLWVLFLAYLPLKANWRTLRMEVKIIGGVVIAVGLVVDVTFNLLASIPLRELPQEWTLSQRAGRYKSWASLRPDCWQVKLATYLCNVWLDPFENGGHCRG